INSFWKCYRLHFGHDSYPFPSTRDQQRLGCIVQLCPTDIEPHLPCPAHRISSGQMTNQDQWTVAHMSSVRSQCNIIFASCKAGVVSFIISERKNKNPIRDFFNPKEIDMNIKPLGD